LRRAVWIVLISLIWAVALALNWVPQLRGGYGWRWHYGIPHDLWRLAPLVMALSVYVVGAWRLLQHRRAAGLLVWTIIGSVALTVTSLYVNASPLFKLFAGTASGISGGWHYAAAQITDLSAVLRDWPHFMQQSTHFSTHMGISPPGLVVVYSVANQILEKSTAAANALGRPLRAMQCHNFHLMDYTNAQLASAWLGILMPVWGSLTVLPLYQLGRYLFDERTARWSILWWPLVPSFLMFAPLPNTFFPLLTVTVFVLLIKGLHRGQAGLVFAAGALMSGMTFISFAFLPLILMAGLFVLGIWIAKTSLFVSSPTAHLAWHWPFWTGLWFGLGLSAVWVIFYAATGQPPWAILLEATTAHTVLDRPYWPWLFLHAYDYGMFSGWPLVALAGLGVWRIATKLRTKQPLSDGEILILAAFAALLILDLSGTLRGESGRILLYLTPFFLLAASYALNRGAAADVRRSSWIFVVGQIAVIVVMVAFLHVIETEFDQEPPPAPPALAQDWLAPPISSGAVLDVLRLNSFSGKIEQNLDAEGRTQSSLVLELEWTSRGQVDTPYLVSLVPVAPDGQVAGQATLTQPLRGLYPTTCWLPRSGPIRDRIQVPLFESDRAGGWWVSLSLLDGRTGQKVSVVMPDGVRDDQIGLGPFYSQP